MSLEHWDAHRRKWVLYNNGALHSDDCEKYPCQEMPRRVFLDTNVVNLLVRFSENVFEQARIPSGIDKTTAHDIEALMHVFHVGTRANWHILASHKVLDEIGKTPNASLREELLEYAVMLVGSRGEDSAYANSVGRRLTEAPFTSALPDLADRELIGNAIGYRCDVFCTCDRRTIISKRDLLTLLPIRILTPVEWWAHVKPWAGLFG